MLLKFKVWLAHQRERGCWDEVERLRRIGGEVPSDHKLFVSGLLNRALDDWSDAKAELAILHARQDLKRRKDPQ